MSTLPVTFACGLYDRMLPLFRGDVQVEGVDLNFIANDSPREIFDRMAGGEEFDVAEFSSSEYIARMGAGKCPFIALPVFPSRVFRHGFIVVNRKSGIKVPKDLEGKRVGVPLYTMTAAIYIRGLLQHEYGVDLSTIHWVQGAVEEPGTHGHPNVMPLLKPVSIEDNATGKSLSDLLDEGEIDAILGAVLPPSLGRNPDIQRLFPNFRAVEKEYYRRTRIFPIMHLIVIRRTVYDKYPFLAPSLYKALCLAKDRALDKMRWLGALSYMLPWMTDDLDEIKDVFGGDPWPYGVEANRPTLEALVRYMREQHLIDKVFHLDDLFITPPGQG